MDVGLEQATWVAAIDDATLRDDIGAGTFLRGLDYANAGRVSELAVADRGRVLLGTVRGSRSRSYQTLVSQREGPISWVARCSCPVGAQCKHAVAVILTARDAIGEAAQQPRPEWEQRLARLLTERRTASRASGPPLALAVETTVRPRTFDHPEPITTVRLRPSRLTKAGTWSKTTTWDEIVDAHMRWRAVPPMDPAHQEALRDLHRLAKRSTRETYAYGARVDVVLDDMGPPVWPSLRAALAAGVVLVPAPGIDATVRLAPAAVGLGLDLRRGEDGSLSVRPDVQGLDADGLGDEAILLGDPAHGLLVRTGEDLVLAELATPVDRSVSDLLVDPRPVRVPAEDAERFVSLVLPRLRRHVPVTSTDRSVDTLTERPPVLDVIVEVPTGREVRLRFGFRYGTVTVPVHRPGDTTPRDLMAERRLIDSLDLLDQVPGARDRANAQVPWTLASEVVLRGMATVGFVSDVLPAMRLHDDIVVTVRDTLPVYEEATEAPVVELATTEAMEEGTDWFDLHVVVVVDGEEVPFEALFSALAREDPVLLLDSGTWFSLQHPAFDQLRQLIEEARGLADPRSDGLRISRFHVGLWEDLVELGVVREQAERWARSVEAIRGLADRPLPEVPHTLTATLRPYQHEGFGWLSGLWDADLGGILADDMGLGKTVQALALLARAHEAGDLEQPVLVVAPTSVLSTWVGEAERFAPKLQVEVLRETSRRRGTSVTEAVRGADLVVTSYAVLRIDADQFAAQPWRAVLLDEAQFVKNHQSKTYHAARRLNAPFRLAMTGTPLENSLMDLWSMLSLTAPGLYPDPHRFSETYRRPIESGSAPELLDTLRRRIKVLMLRRTKEQVASDLPPKQVQLLSVPLHPQHERLYHQHLQRERQRVLGLLDDPDANRVAILASLTRLRQLALHPALVDDDDAVPAAGGALTSAKVETLVEHLAELAGEGHRALVFSQFTRFLRLVQQRLTDEGIDTCYLDGRTRNREAVIERFRTGDAPAFLISLKAGGFGLTLTEADYVFVLDPWWNPAVESQAIDRAHRIGQDRPVMVYRLVSTSTVEEKVVALQDRKRDLFERVVDDGGALSSGGLTTEDIRGLLEP